LLFIRKGAPSGAKTISRIAVGTNDTRKQNEMAGMANDLSNGQRFLDAFNSIESTLRSRSSADPRPSFSDLVRKTRDLVPRQRDLLLDYAELRNIIVHTRTLNGQLIADPRSDVVDRIEEQADLIERPPRILEALRLSPPQVFQGSDSIVEFLNVVKPPRYFSQAPVATAGDQIELVTTNAVARWMAESWETSQGVVLSEASIDEILAYSEPSDRVEIRGKDLKVVDAWRIFSGEAGDPPAAILITHSGKKTERPLGLCVRADLPAMLKTLKV
jgi:predicted transcriptional regulator